MNLRYASKQITLQEVPNEVSLSYLMTGCPLKCEWCHSESAKDGTKGVELTPSLLREHIEATNSLITCVLFLWGEWNEEKLLPLLDVAIEAGMKTALYSWFEKIDNPIKEKLSYLKVWPYIKELGGLSESTTNQRMYNLRSWEELFLYK